MRRGRDQLAQQQQANLPLNLATTQAAIVPPSPPIELVPAVAQGMAALAAAVPSQPALPGRPQYADRLVAFAMQAEGQQLYRWVAELPWLVAGAGWVAACVKPWPGGLMMGRGAASGHVALDDCWCRHALAVRS
jgi:hypothetical protein